MRYNEILVIASGEVYVGQRDDKKKGVGNCAFTDGSLYEGEWSRDTNFSIWRQVYWSF